MASEYTPNRRYPLYTDADKPNLRDQYNGAIREIDTDMAQALSDSSGVAAALGSGYDAQHTVRMAIDALDSELDTKASSSALTAETNARTSADDALGQRITDEITSRTSADDALGQRITDEITSRTSADNALSNRINVLENPEEYLVIVGDSWSQHSYPDTQYFWWNIVARAYNLIPYNAAIGGTGFVIGNPNFYQQLTNAHQALSNKTVKKVIIFGGMNDVGNFVNRINFGNAVATCATHARELFPDAHITIAGIAPHFMYNQYFNADVPDYDAVGHYSSLLQYMGVGIDKCDEYIDARFFGLFDLGFFDANQNHPSIKGHQDIACRMLGGDANIWEIHTHNQNANPILILPDNSIVSLGNPLIKPMGRNMAGIAFGGSIPSALAGQTGVAYILTKGAPPIGYWTEIHSQSTSLSTGLSPVTVKEFDGTTDEIKYTSKYSFNMVNGLNSGYMWVSYTINV